MAIFRRAGLTAAVGLVLFLTGCGSGGGGRATNVVNTGSNVGTLANLVIDPPPGSVFISKSTVFRLLWTDGATPPPTFSVTLQRYKEPASTNGNVVAAQKTDFTREGDTYAWDLSRSDNFTLDESGVYYVEVDSDSEQVLASFIVSGLRSEKVGATRAAAVRAPANPGPVDTGLVHIVHL